LNAKENLQKVEGEKVSLLARITELEEQVQSALLATEALRTNNEPVDEVKITENDDAGMHSELGAKISALTEELDRLSKLREADLDQILGILQEWKNSENKEEQQTLTDYLQRLDDWFTQDEGGMTQEELAKYS
jgi:uncharacterized protein YPO0396